ncbi:hypothetical protein [Paraburkholderia sp. GAS334]|uniref:hypothetical protein n=1 Tax=Paraburkholderia sp. GAS334 TaxID=3035131 RepID=UPI003D213914
MLRHIPARSGQSPVQFPSFVQAGRHAADLWLVAAPLSAGEFRDLRYRNLLSGMPMLADEAERREAFNDAYARRIAEAIVRASLAPNARTEVVSHR